jgi:hypothetical protein
MTSGQCYGGNIFLIALPFNIHTTQQFRISMASLFLLCSHNRHLSSQVITQILQFLNAKKICFFFPVNYLFPLVKTMSGNTTATEHG